MPQHVDLLKVDSRDESQLWNWVIAEYHYLGLATPVGRTLRYLILGDGGLLGAIGFGECAWNLAPRNAAIHAAGLEPNNYRSFLIANNRFLILPTVNVPNLASKILSMSLTRASRDWSSEYGQRPLLVETFIDPSRFTGTCYLAANWLFIGNTRGYAKRGASHENRKSPKILMMRGIESVIHRRLEMAYPPGGTPTWTEAA